jgi:uncharacterized tellurite resistance protein B-like protein
MELIESMPPGLYEIIITEKPDTEAPSQGERGEFDLSIEERGLDDVRALGCNSLEDEREFAAVERISELNNACYQAFVQPWIKMISGPQLASAALGLNPLRLGYSLLSDKNLFMQAVAPLAAYAKEKRVSISADNPFLTMQQRFSQNMVDALNLFRDLRDDLLERTFHAVYGSPLVQAVCGIGQDNPPRQRPGLAPSIVAAAEKERRRLEGRIAEGNLLDAAARVLVYIGKAQHRIDKSTFETLRKLLLEHPEVSPSDFKATVREQWAILAVDERAAIEALPQLLPADPMTRRDLSDQLQAIVAATGKLKPEGQRRLRKVLDLLAAKTDQAPASRSERQFAAE